MTSDQHSTFGPQTRRDWNPERIRAYWDTLNTLIPHHYSLRHEIHQHPDLSGQEEATALRLLAALGKTDVPDVKGGRILRIGTSDGPAIALRTELDALPITEETGLNFCSTNSSMHACGHDIHMAALVAVAKTIETVGPVVPLALILQPREESVPSGAMDMIEAPELRDADIKAVIGAHVQPRLPYGTFSALAGPVNASADDFQIVIEADGGHAGYPHTTGDPILTASLLVVQVQGLVARQVDPTHASAITFGSITGGFAPNVIPNQVTLSGTIRASDPSDRDLLKTRLIDICHAVSTTHGCEAEVQIFEGEPILSNDEQLAHATVNWIRSETCIEEGPPLRSCGADDFAYYGSLFPSLMVFVGVGRPDGPGLHSSTFAPPDSAIDLVAHVLLSGYLAACETLLGPMGD